MLVKEFMERVGTKSTGRAIAYLKDAMEDMNIYSETHIEQDNISIVSGQRFYDLPQQMVKMVDFYKVLLEELRGIIIIKTPIVQSHG